MRASPRIHRRKVWIPDLFIAPEDLDEIPDEEDLGVDASGVQAVFEVVSPGREAQSRDRERKRRAYARAGIPLYVLIDDFDGDGTVVVLTNPNAKKADYADEHRVPYGTDAAIPGAAHGPAAPLAGPQNRPAGSAPSILGVRGPGSMPAPLVELVP